MTFQEDDEEEVQSSQLILLLFRQMEELDSALEPFMNPERGSRLFLDDARSPHHTVSGYAHGQLSVALGCIAALKHMTVRESEQSTNLTAGPYGAYALVRNAMDAAATALWLLEPVNGKLRIKRRFMLGIDEIVKTDVFRRTLGKPSIKVARLNRMQEIAALAGMEQWDPQSLKVPTMTQVLAKIERWHTAPVLPWLAAWQLASGHAHGKVWAQLASHDVQELQETRTQTGAQFRVSIRYAMLATLLREAAQLTRTAGERYIELASTPTGA